jgi:signal transduction histidine kinase
MNKEPHAITILHDITERKQAEQKILEYQKRLKQLASQLTLVEEQERRRIAGQLHDEVSQILAMAKIKLDTLRNSPPSETSAAVLEEINSSIKKVIQETRTLTFELSNPILYELGFEAAVAEWLNDNVQVKHGIATEFHDDELPKPLDDDLKAMLFRNTRELLTNCIKHAKAGEIMVGLRRIDDSIEVTVEDNGVGFDPVQVRTKTGKKTTYGLFSIRENMENTGGRFEIDSKPGAGCKAIMTAPLKKEV